MNESQPSSDRDRNNAAAKKYPLRQAEEPLEALYAVEADDEKARAEATAEPPADGDPDDGLSNDLSDGRDAASPEDLVAWVLAAEDYEDFVRRVFQDFGARLDKLGYRIAVVVEDGRLDAGQCKALSDRIAVSGEQLLNLAYAVKNYRGG